MDVKEYNRKYYEANKDKLIERSRLWREKNQERMNTKIICGCGGRYITNNKTNHKRTNKHTTWIRFQKQFEDLKK